MKKVLSVLLVLMMVLSLMPSGALTLMASAETSGYYTYTVTDGEATITDVVATSIRGEVVIPSMLGGYPVTSIEERAFYECTRLTSITIPDSVTSIGNSAFLYCPSLTSVTIPDSVTSIGNWAFDCCPSLTSITVDPENAHYSSVDGVLFNRDKTTLICYPAGKTETEYTIPDNVTSIGVGAFLYCRNLTSITIPNSVTSIGEHAFAFALLESITIPDSVTSIGEYAFSSCPFLESITIPGSVTSIGDYAFAGCTSLESVYITDMESWCEIDFRDSDSNPLCYADSLYLNGELVTSLTIPSGVTSIGDFAFYNYSNLTSVMIPDSVTEIGKSAFYNCGLTDIWYAGGKEEQALLFVEDGNSSLTSATWHYNTCSDEHNYGGDCDSSCNVCEYTRVATGGHIYSGDCDDDCNACGDTRELLADHIYNNDIDADCNVCGATRSITGWKEVDGVWYYFDHNSVMQIGWRQIGSIWYYFRGDGKMATGWQQAGDKWYYFNDDGAMQTGWLDLNEKRYYLNTNGSMQIGWLVIDESRYYFNQNGEMQIGWLTIDHDKYLFNNNGVCIEGAKLFIIDISKWQGNINWDKLAQTDVDGVILRISYGGTTTDNNGNAKDTRFDEYIENLERLQIPYGVYHFNTATTLEMAEIQAQNVIGILKETGADPGLPVFVDIETNGGECDLIEIAKVYMSEFITNGYKPGIYANQNYWNNYLNSPEFHAYYRWIANYGLNNGFPSATFAPKDGIENYMMWQYTSAGKIDGIDENTVDLNVLYEWYLKPDGWKEIAGKKYHYSNGLCTYGWLYENDNLYYVNSYGEMAVGWFTVDDARYYTNDDGVVQTNWQLIDGLWYYLSSNGVMQTGWQFIGGKWYYLNGSGAMVTGWQQIGGKWYYFSGGGAMQTGWQQIGGKWYYLSGSGAMVTGWQQIGGKWYYLNGSGAMQTGWQQIGPTWYYFNAGGSMVTGWLKLGPTWYYFNNSGAMQTGWLKIGSVWYLFNASGAWVQ